MKMFNRFVEGTVVKQYCAILCFIVENAGLLDEFSAIIGIEAEIENVSILIDHAAHKGSNYLKGHCGTANHAGISGKKGCKAVF